jgi:hypothetical protein
LNGTSQRLQAKRLNVGSCGIIGSGVIVVLDQVYDVKDCQHPSKAGLFAVPKRCRNNAYEASVTSKDMMMMILTVEKETLQGLLDIKFRI